MSGQSGAPGPPSEEGSFEARLRAAHGRREPDAGRAATSRQDASALGIGLRVGIELVSALVVAIAIGWGLDRWLHTLPLFLILFTLLGGAAGVANVWRVMMPRRAG